MMWGELQLDGTTTTWVDHPPLCRCCGGRCRKLGACADGLCDSCSGLPVIDRRSVPETAVCARVYPPEASRYGRTPIDFKCFPSQPHTTAAALRHARRFARLISGRVEVL